jgi:NTE family protein
MVKDITLALGGGGIRGVAHIGVVRVLESHGFKIKAIAGTSAGGIFGAAYAAGFNSQEIEELAKNFAENPRFKRHSSDRPSLLGVDGIYKILAELLGKKTIEELPVPFVTTAVSIDAGKEIIISKGKVVDAVLATIAIPGVLPSQEIGGKILMDGGVLDPVPVKAARWLIPSLPVVAVVLHKKPENFQDSSKHLPFTIPIPSTIIEQITKLRLVEALTIFTRSAEVSSNRLSDLNLIIDQPDVTIAPLVGQYNLLDKVNASDLIHAGEIAAELMIPQLEKACRNSQLIRRRLKYGIIPLDKTRIGDDIDFID